MSSYTTEVRYICESYAGLTDSTGFSGIDDVLNKSVEKVFDFTFPIFDENYRIPLEKKILKHFYTREISEETVGLWKLRLEETLDEIMPYYNQLYRTQIEGINPWYNIDLETTHSGTGSKDTDGNRNSTGTNYENGNKTTTYNGINEHTTSNENDVMEKGTQKTVNYGGDKVTKDVGSEGGWSKNVRDTSNIEKTTGTSKNTNKYKDDVLNAWNENFVNRYSDTPQGSLQNMKAIDDNLYLTNATINDTQHNGTTFDQSITTDNGSTTSNTTDSGKQTDNYTRGLTDTNTRTETFQNRQDKTVNSGSDVNNKTTNKDVTKSGSINENESATGGQSNNETRNENIKTTEEYIEHVSGYKGVKSIAAMIMEWRKSLINIDAMIMKDLEDCFFQLW